MITDVLPKPRPVCGHPRSQPDCARSLLSNPRPRQSPVGTGIGAFHTIASSLRLRTWSLIPRSPGRMDSWFKGRTTGHDGTNVCTAETVKMTPVLQRAGIGWSQLREPDGMAAGPRAHPGHPPSAPRPLTPQGTCAQAPQRPVLARHVWLGAEEPPAEPSCGGRHGVASPIHGCYEADWGAAANQSEGGSCGTRSGLHSSTDEGRLACMEDPRRYKCTPE